MHKRFAFFLAGLLLAIGAEAAGMSIQYYNRVILVDDPEIVRAVVPSRLFFGRTNPAAPSAGQPWYLWGKRPAQIEADDFTYTRASDLTLFRGVQYQRANTTYYIDAPDLSSPEWIQEPAYTSVNFQAFRQYSVAAQIVQRLYLWKPTKADVEPEGIVSARPLTVFDVKHVYFQVAPGQPFFSWKQTHGDPQAEDVYIPPTSMFALTRVTIPTVLAASTDEYIIRNRRRGRR